MNERRGGKATATLERPRNGAYARPTPEEIRLRAYEIHLSRNGAPGDEMEDWLQAEREFSTGSAEK